MHLDNPCTNCAFLAQIGAFCPKLDKLAHLVLIWTNWCIFSYFAQIGAFSPILDKLMHFLLRFTI